MLKYLSKLIHYWLCSTLQKLERPWNQTENCFKLLCLFLWQFCCVLKYLNLWRSVQTVKSILYRHASQFRREGIVAKSLFTWAETFYSGAYPNSWKWLPYVCSKTAVIACFDLPMVRKFSFPGSNVSNVRAKVSFFLMFSRAFSADKLP